MDQVDHRTQIQSGDGSKNDVPSFWSASTDSAMLTRPITSSTIPVSVKSCVDVPLLNFLASTSKSAIHGF